MLKQVISRKLIIVALLAGGFTAVSAAEANAWVVRRVAPVRRIAARAVLPPYPVARRAVFRPVVYRRPIYSRPLIYSAPVYRTGISVNVGGGYYGW